jgi:hypothetical protein
MFTLYCDDSGTHAQSDVAIAGCYIATVEQWQHLKRNWVKVDAKEKFGVFHMADFVGKYKQFGEPEWQDEEKRDRTLWALIGIINARVRIGIAAAVIKSAYDEIIPADLRERLGKNHYTFAVRMCISFVEQWRKRHGYITEPIQYVFDQMTKGKGDIEDAMKIGASGGSDGLRRYGIYEDGWSFQSKKNVIQLQAADMWAYENYKYAMERYFAPEDQRKPVRKSYHVLRSKPHTIVRYMSRPQLEELVKKMRYADVHGH